MKTGYIMEKLFGSLFAMIAVVMFSIVFPSCGHEDPVPATVSVSGVSLNKTSLNLLEGGSETLTATVAPDNATNKSISWKSSDNGVATVDNSGKVTAVKAGSATITVTTTDGSKTATCSVTVTAKTVSVTGVTLNKSTLELTEGAEETLKATITPSDATNQVVTWSTSDNNIAKVSDGKVTAVKAGEATITVTTSDGGKTATCKVTVKAVALEGLSVNPATLEIVEGETKQLEVKFTPEAFGDKSVQWAADNTGIVSVDNNGLITALKPGTAKVYVKSMADETIQAFCEVTVTPDPTLKGISFPYTSLTMKKGETKQFKVVFDPEYAQNKNVTWKSSNPAVATVDNAGKVTSKGNGETDITATSEEGGFTATCKVTVSQQLGAQVYIRTYDGVFLNGEKYISSRDYLDDIYSDGIDLYECFVYDGIYKNGSLLLDNFHKGYDLMGVASGRLYYFDYDMIHIYDAANGQSLFEEMLSADYGYRNVAMEVAADGTAYVAGYSFDAFGTRVGRLWTISKDFKVTEQTMYHGGTEEAPTDLALDSEGNVWVVAKADGCLNLYKNAKYVRSINVDRDGNRDHYLSFNGKDLYVVTTLDTQEDIVVYKNDKVIYELSSKDGLMARSKPIITKSGDVYFAAGSRGIDKSIVYKNGKILYSLGGGDYVFRFYVLE